MPRFKQLIKLRRVGSQKLIITSSSRTAPCIIPTPTVGELNDDNNSNTNNNNNNNDNNKNNNNNNSIYIKRNKDNNAGQK